MRRVILLATPLYPPAHSMGEAIVARGSIQVRKGPRGVAYRVRAEYGPDPVSGRRKQRSKTFLARREAEAYLTRWQAEIERGIAVEPSTVTVAEQVRYWLDTYARTGVNSQTFSEYERMVRSHVATTLGAVPLQKLTVAHVEACKSELLVSGVGTRTVTMCLMRLRQMLAQAIDLHLIATNAAGCVQNPEIPPDDRSPGLLWRLAGFLPWPRERLRSHLSCLPGNWHAAR